MKKSCKYCGISTHWSQFDMHKHCKVAYNRGKLAQTFSVKQIQEIELALKTLKQIIK